MSSILLTPDCYQRSTVALMTIGPYNQALKNYSKALSHLFESGRRESEPLSFKYVAKRLAAAILLTIPIINSIAILIFKAWDLKLIEHNRKNMAITKCIAKLKVRIIGIRKNKAAKKIQKQFRTWSACRGARKELEELRALKNQRMGLFMCAGRLKILAKRAKETNHCRALIKVDPGQVAIIAVKKTWLQKALNIVPGAVKLATRVDVRHGKAALENFSGSLNALTKGKLRASFVLAGLGWMHGVFAVWERVIPRPVRELDRLQRIC